MLTILTHWPTLTTNVYVSLCSFIRESEPGLGAQWLEFNDTEVTPFDFSTLADKCFGGLALQDVWDEKLKKHVGLPATLSVFFVVCASALSHISSIFLRHFLYQQRLTTETNPALFSTLFHLLCEAFLVFRWSLTPSSVFGHPLL